MFRLTFFLLQEPVIEPERSVYHVQVARDPWAAQPQQATASPAPVDPFSPSSPVKTSEGADLLAADWSSGGAANGNGGALGGGGCPSIAPQVQFHIQSFLLLIFCKSFVFQVAANHWDLSGLDPMAGSAGPTGAIPKTGVQSLLGEHSNLVNLDNLTQVTRLLLGYRNLAHLF